MGIDAGTWVAPPTSPTAAVPTEPPAPVPDPADGAHAGSVISGLVAQVSARIVGQRAPLEILAAALLSGNHVLIEDLPGTGKTTAARELAQALGLTFRRVQGTPDVLPGDITGTLIWHPGEGALKFNPGPIFTSVLLVDEINRMPPRSQAALFEAMEERQVTIDGQTYLLPEPFVVIATQNPADHAGTFPLPENLVDRFSCCVTFEPLAFADELRVLDQELRRPHVAPVGSAPSSPASWSGGGGAGVSPAVLAYAATVVRAVRSVSSVAGIASVRASLDLLEVAGQLALLRGREFVTPDDIQFLAPAVLAHRLVAHHQVATLDEGRAVVRSCLDRVPVPPGGLHDVPR